MVLTEGIASKWRSRLETDLSGQSAAVRESILLWLMGEDQSRFEDLTPELHQITEQTMDYRYRILRQRYLEVDPKRGYKRLIQRLASLFLIRNKVRTWIALSRDRQCSVVDVLEEVIQQLLQTDTYMQQQILWISKCTQDARLRNALLLASTEEYCLRPIRNQPLLSYRFINYMRRSQQDGSTQISNRDFIRLVSEEVTPDDIEGAIKFLDSQAIAQYQDTQAIAEQQELQNSVKQTFEAYLVEKVSPVAAQWLTLYLQGRSQEEIAQALDIPVKQVYHLRERINYHAVRAFSSKSQQELLKSWRSEIQGSDLYGTSEPLHSEENVQLTENYTLKDSTTQEIEVYLDEKPTSATIELLERIFEAKFEEPITQSSTSSEFGGEFSTKLPLLDLFTQLKEVGLPLGIDEYFLALRALQKGFGTVNHESLADLCRTLWVKSRDEEHLFNYHFEQVMQTFTLPTASSPAGTEQEPLPRSPAPDVKQETSDEDPKTEELPTPTTATAISQELMEVEDEIQVAEAVQIATRSDGEVVINRFTQSDEYFPVTRRQMKQSWRYLRRMVREGPPVEIDIEATIARFSQQGIPSDPVLVPERINRTELLLLLDHKGSMVPFHALSQRLAETAQRGGRLGEAGVFYFHNCPTHYLYRDPSRQQAELVSNLLMKLSPERSVVLIFSDGGAARGAFNPERVELTNQFLDRLKERVRHITWLNPMSKDRWVGTTAGEIAQRVPMFEMSRKGMDGAVDVLRGRSLQVIG